METVPYDQRLARILVRPLTKTPITPNQITIFTIILALWGTWLIASGEPTKQNWGAGLFILARFLDHFDGELARMKQMSSKLGYYLDYAGGGISHAALFIAMGLGFRYGILGDWAIALGLAGLLAAFAAVFVNLGIDNAERGQKTVDACGYPGFGGFELEDGTYLLGPVTWLGFLEPFFILACLGAVVYLLWSSWVLFRLKRKCASS